MLTFVDVKLAYCNVDVGEGILGVLKCIVFEILKSSEMEKT